MAKRILFWFAPVVLFVVIVVLGYQIFYSQNDDISSVLQQELTIEPEPEPDFPDLPPLPDTPSPESSSPMTLEREVVQTPPGTAGSANSMEPETTMERAPTTTMMVVPETPTTTMVKVSTETSEVASGQSTTSSQKSSSGNKTAKKAMRRMALPAAALVETNTSLWGVVSNTNKPTPSAWQTMMVQNKNKMDYTVRPTDLTQWGYVNDGKKVKVQFGQESESQKDILSRKNQGKYAMQMMSVESKRFDLAQHMLKQLVEDGYYAYIHRTNEKFKGSHWYRVRVGFYKTSEEAQAHGQEIYYRYRDEGVLPKNFWAVLPSPHEISHEIVDIRQQQNKPWIIELPLYTDQKTALGDFPKVSDVVDFSYLSFRETADNKAQYRIRLGFFESQSETDKTLRQLRDIRRSLEQSTVTRL